MLANVLALKFFSFFVLDEIAYLSSISKNFWFGYKGTLAHLFRSITHLTMRIGLVYLLSMLFLAKETFADDSPNTIEDISTTGQAEVSSDRFSD